MIDLYTWGTPNGRKIAIMLEETGLAYRVHKIDIENGEQFAPAFLKISPNNRIPAIVDHDVEGGPLSVFESGAILLHLAEKTGQFIPADPRQRSACLQWLFWQMGGLGPGVGQFNHYRNKTGPEYAYSLARHTDEAARLFGVLDKRLADVPCVAGPYSVADMAIYPWVISGKRRISALKGLSWPNIDRWESELVMRPALARGMTIPSPPS